MLKLTYTENNFNLERLDESLEKWVNIRVTLAIRSNTPIHLESSSASFLLAGEYVPQVFNLEQENRVELYRCDEDLVEVVLEGLWLTSDPESEVGIFVTNLEESTELLFEQMQQNLQLCHT
ncbi:alr0857 family protein [Mastigocoleus testarum]|uniref:Uncharacterized protein n=1 Tax=Mastigocoleus testarum BC008 TaxID=371196 RepID=A0A0V7ZKC2_9CYAN|nr:alr0857 family protein [Mastigocoleus testarum]KST65045.1 hypothetical protein BC008_19770 [Mastigocoleus testarum BC008]